MLKTSKLGSAACVACVEDAQFCSKPQLLLVNTTGLIISPDGAVLLKSDVTESSRISGSIPSGLAAPEIISEPMPPPVDLVEMVNWRPLYWVPPHAMCKPMGLSEAVPRVTV